MKDSLLKTQKRNFIKFCITIYLFLAFLAPGTVAAATYGGFLSGIRSFSISLGSALATLMLVYSGIRYLTSQGNPSAINEAKDIMIGSLSGFALLLLADYVLGLINIS